MHRPRNRQQRPARQEQHGDQNQRRSQGRHWREGKPSLQYPTSVPNVQQVLPGAPVSIVLKVDQPTGRQVQGLVQDVLTRGNHPRGIKVRLQDGRVGRVQGMASHCQDLASSLLPTAGNQTEVRPTRQEIDQPPSNVPVRTLQDFMPRSDSRAAYVAQNVDDPVFTTATVKCPICGQFEGDATAVSHHVDGHFD